MTATEHLSLTETMIPFDSFHPSVALFVNTCGKTDVVWDEKEKGKYSLNTMRLLFEQKDDGNQKVVSKLLGGKEQERLLYSFFLSFSLLLYVLSLSSSSTIISYQVPPLKRNPLIIIFALLFHSLRLI